MDLYVARHNAELWRPLLAVTLAVLVLAGMLAGLFIRSFSRRVSQIRAYAERLLDPQISRSRCPPTRASWASGSLAPAHRSPYPRVGGDSKTGKLAARSNSGQHAGRGAGRGPGFASDLLQQLVRPNRGGTHPGLPGDAFARTGAGSGAARDHDQGIQPGSGWSAGSSCRPPGSCVRGARRAPGSVPPRAARSRSCTTSPNWSAWNAFARISSLMFPTSCERLWRPFAVTPKRCWKAHWRTGQHNRQVRRDHFGPGGPAHQHRVRPAYSVGAGVERAERPAAAISFRTALESALRTVESAAACSRANHLWKSWKTARLSGKSCASSRSS